MRAPNYGKYGDRTRHLLWASSGGTVLHSVELFAEQVSWRSLNNPDWCVDRRSLSDIGTSLPRIIFTENAKCSG